MHYFIVMNFDHKNSEIKAYDPLIQKPGVPMATGYRHEKNLGTDGYWENFRLCRPLSKTLIWFWID